ncbi:hypothetical protein OF117_08400 [Geodermatophilus sp. YIM 151500]|uniref:hypothetical protein n=1 Tax=Geodermatophilus sp. YIM 151500 TaxID=2984531 RepID=UPI0021E4A6EA|nr:hypothetical protein [Geodermatophilus sp. YIM 151500]MCV2489386.1 hypothetical protein [Geodermatophilus sp. YIM 151500]
MFTLLAVLTVLAALTLLTVARWLQSGTDGRPRVVDLTYVAHPELYGQGRIGLS